MLGPAAQDAPHTEASDAPAVFGWPKVCLCGESYERFDWSKLPWIGVMRLFRDEALEMRNCRCGSTLAVPEDLHQPSVFERHADALRVAGRQKDRAQRAVREARHTRDALRARVELIRFERQSRPPPRHLFR